MGDPAIKIMLPFRRLFHSSSGQSVVEFALVIPILLLLLIGIYDIGQMIYIRHVLVKASREAARAGVVELDSNQAVIAADQWCLNVLRDHNVAGVCTITETTIGSADGIHVEAAHDYHMFFGRGQFAWMPNLRLNAASTMRKEG